MSLGNADIKIRTARAGDVPLCAALLAAEGLPVEDLSETVLALVAERGNGLVGAIGIETFGAVGLLRSLIVAPAGRSAGLGRRLVSDLEALARADGIAELWLLTIDADRWFTRLGYERAERKDAPEAIRSTAEYSSLCPDDAVLMRKRL